MNAVIGSACLLEKINLPCNASELVRKSGVAGHPLLAIISDVLDELPSIVALSATPFKVLSA